MSFFLGRILDALGSGGDAPAFVRDGRTTTYAEAHELLLRLHGTLLAEGVGEGDLVAVLGGNRPETILGQLAVQLRGASVLLVPESASTPARAEVLGKVTACLAEPGPKPDGVRVIPLRPSEMDTVDEPGELPPSVHTVFASGGTTGSPKLIAHRGIYDGMAHIFRPDPLGPNRVLLVAPLSHLTGNCAVLGALLCGDTVVLHAGFDAGDVLDAIARHRITHLTLTPPRLARVLDHPALSGTDVSSVRRLSLGASPLPARRLSQALAAFGPVVGQGYGLTEAPMIASIAPEEYDGHPERLRSVGRIVPGMEARIDDGEVLVRGLALMEGYHGSPELTGKAFTDGWLRTGDLGRFDADGYLYLLDRADDVIVTGEHGTKVYSTVVEDALVAHPRVRQAAVLGVDGPDGRLVHAVVVAEPGLTADEVRDHVRRVLGGEHFVPASVDFAPTLPLTPIGKIDKAALMPG
ncbi:class I adenylate-forming enzyme family protein [Prauserella endophytica]|uniref:Fatty acid--CoA ligase n=1 Tax=Prauserella endophytica TaxID=1592324 RepID=A0ABY2RX33_9PSEU|nr:AMP-binding protein [Prauserella endophytica]TKG64244.1 fatty acid--CoA ligase [Prauserella endophytica]